ncbi:MAG: AAA family ATPase [Gemmatimonadetes bacterium]|nr:AAA family ATPase [Gemmatimonadota bacterium]
MLRNTDLSPLSRLVQRVDAAADGVATGDAFATGFPSIDKWLGSGLRRGDLVVVGGEVGAGKSALTLAMALRMAQSGVNSAFFSAEMSVDRVMERILAIEGRARVDDIRRGTLGEVTRAAVGAAAVRLRDGAPIIEVLPPGGIDTLGDALRRTLDLQVAFVDPLQALTLGVRDQAEELATAVRGLKALALASGAAIVATADFPNLPSERAGERPTLGDFDPLGAVKQHADVVLGVYREEMQQPGTGVDGATELLVLKNRNGGTGYVDSYFYKQWLRFEDMLDPDL